jgi:hypothetical protein
MFRLELRFQRFWMSHRAGTPQTLADLATKLLAAIKGTRHARSAVARLLALLPRSLSSTLSTSDLFNTGEPGANYRWYMDRRDLLAGLVGLGLAWIVGRGDAMEPIEAKGVLFIAGFGPIVRDTAASRKLYGEALGISFKEETGSYLHTGDLQGAKEFALWPLSQAAQSCFGKDSWPSSVATPQAWLEFDVEDVEKATAELESRGYQMLVRNKKEPWGQTVSRFISPEGMLVGITFTPSMRQAK